MYMRRHVFQELLEGQRHRIYSYALYFLQNHEDAEDVVQEAFIRLWQRCKAPDRKGMQAWLVRVTHNLCIDVKRRRQRAPIGLNDEETLHRLATQATVSVDSDPTQLLELDERQRILLTAMEELPDTTQSFLLLHYFQGLTYREIGEITHTNTNTVKVQVHRGRQALKRILAGSLSDQSEQSEQMESNC